jgi:hypothetical protein
MSWPDSNINYHGLNIIGSNVIVIKRKKKHLIHLFIYFSFIDYRVTFFFFLIHYKFTIFPIGVLA